MSYFRRLAVQNTIGLIILSIFLVVFAIGISWAITCLFVYWISLLWAGTILAFTWSWEFATGIWLALCLLGSFTSVRVNFND